MTCSTLTRSIRGRRTVAVSCVCSEYQSIRGTSMERGEPFHDFLPKLMRAKKIGPSTAAWNAALAHVQARSACRSPTAHPMTTSCFTCMTGLRKIPTSRRTAPKQELVCPVCSSWMVYTDGVPHPPCQDNTRWSRLLLFPGRPGHARSLRRARC